MNAPSPVDKNSAGVGERQYHIAVAPGEVSTVALLPGDPFRVPLIAEFLTDVKTIAHNREHLTMTGSIRVAKLPRPLPAWDAPRLPLLLKSLFAWG